MASPSHSQGSPVISDNGTISNAPMGLLNESIECVECVVKDILACYFELSTLPSLDPSPVVNQAFEKLVALCCQVSSGESSQKVCSFYLKERVIAANG